MPRRVRLLASRSRGALAARPWPAAPAPVVLCEARRPFRRAQCPEIEGGLFAESSGYVRFINHSVRMENCENTQITLFDQQVSTGIVHVRTTKDVPAGAQFFLNYGTSYWDSKLELEVENPLERALLRFKIDNL